MSSYKNQIFKYFEGKTLIGSKILSIGSQDDDRRYFKDTQYDDWSTLDSSPKYKPTFVLDMNESIINQDGEILIDTSFADAFDIVLCLNIFEYIWNPVAAHDNLSFFLKAGGTLYVNYPFIYPQHEPAGTDFLRYTPEGARKLLSEAGFIIQDEQALYGNQGLLKFYQNDGMKARANADHLIIGMIFKVTKQ